MNERFAEFYEQKGEQRLASWDAWLLDNLKCTFGVDVMKGERGPNKYKRYLLPEDADLEDRIDFMRYKLGDLISGSAEALCFIEPENIPSQDEAYIACQHFMASIYALMQIANNPATSQNDAHVRYQAHRKADDAFKPENARFYARDFMPTIMDTRLNIVTMGPETGIQMREAPFPAYVLTDDDLIGRVLGSQGDATMELDAEAHKQNILPYNAAFPFPRPDNPNYFQRNFAALVEWAKRKQEEGKLSPIADPLQFAHRLSNQVAVNKGNVSEIPRDHFEAILRGSCSSPGNALIVFTEFTHFLTNEESLRPWIQKAGFPVTI